MKLEHFEFFAYRLGYARRVNWFNSSEDAADYLALRLVGEDGSVGFAEAPLKPTWTGMSPRAHRALVEDLLLPALAEVDLTDEAAVSAALAVYPVPPEARMLVANACAVLAASASGTPLWQRFGDRPDAALSWCVTRQSPADMAAEAADMVARHGFETLKIKGGQGQATDREILRAIRAAVGPSVALTVDANCAYRPEDTPDYLRMLADETVVVAEDPCLLRPGADFAALTNKSPLPLLVDMPCKSLADARLFLEAGAQAISVKPGRVGLPEAALMATAARRAGADFCSGLYAESALGALISLAFSAGAADALLPAEQSFHLFMQNTLVDIPPIVGGMITLPDTPDLAACVDWDGLRRHAERHPAG